MMRVGPLGRCESGRSADASGKPARRSLRYVDRLPSGARIPPALAPPPTPSRMACPGGPDRPEPRADHRRGFRVTSSSPSRSPRRTPGSSTRRSRYPASVGSSIFLVLGALQFAPSLRRRRWHRRRPHRRARRPDVGAVRDLDVPLLRASADVTVRASSIRLVLGTAMAAAIVVAFLAIRRGDVPLTQCLDDPGLRDRSRRGHAAAHVPPVDAAGRGPEPRCTPRSWAQHGRSTSSSPKS